MRLKSNKWIGRFKHRILFARLFFMTAGVIFLSSCEMALDNEYVDIQIMSQDGKSIEKIFTDTAIQLKAVGVFVDGTTQDITDEVTWSSLSPEIVTISDVVKGLVNPVGAGSATIQVELGDKTASYVLSVDQSVLKELKLIAPMLSFAKGTSQQLSVRGVYSSGEEKDLTNLANWSSSQESIVSLSTMTLGFVTAVKKGSSVIHLEYNGFSATVELQVTDATLVSLTIQPDKDFLLRSGDVVQLSATGSFSDQTVQDVTKSVDWLISDDLVAQFSSKPNEKGSLIGGTTAGMADIQASLLGISSSKVHVTSIVLRKLEISPESIKTMIIGEKASFTVMGFYSDDSMVELTDHVTWSSSASSIVSIASGKNNAGRIEGLSNGDAEISADFLGVKSLPVKIKVAKVVSMELTPSIYSILKKDKLQIIAYGTLSDGTAMKNITKLSTWSSSDDKVASVDSTGLLTGEKEGSVDITAIFQGVTSTKSTIQVVKK